MNGAAVDLAVLRPGFSSDLSKYDSPTLNGCNPRFGSQLGPSFMV